MRMNINVFHQILKKHGIEYFAGVPDSQLREFCDCLMEQYGISDQHMITPNEGTSVGCAAGYHLATGKVPCVYMQNSGIGNAVNPVASLLNTKVYAIPTLFVIGWRGEPGVKDEPQHIFQGEITLPLLELLEIEYLVMDGHTQDSQFEEQFAKLATCFITGKSAAIVVKKGAFQSDAKHKYQNTNSLNREYVIKEIVKHATDEDVFVSSTGKISREFFEIRAGLAQGHSHDFLTVGSMGHCSAIALSIAEQKSSTRVVCIDGDGAALMHMGTMALIGSRKPHNLTHIMLDNAAHETVGGMPTVSCDVDFAGIAKACGYEAVFVVQNQGELDVVLDDAFTLRDKLVFVIIKVTLASRKDLGRPTRTTIENKQDFMKFLESDK